MTSDNEVLTLLEVGLDLPASRSLIHKLVKREIDGNSMLPATAAGRRRLFADLEKRTKKSLPSATVRTYTNPKATFGRGDVYVPRKYLNAKLEQRTDVKRPFWFVRVWEAAIINGARDKKRVVKQLGFCDEMDYNEAMAARARILRVANDPRMATRPILRFSEVWKHYENVWLPDLGVAVQARYPSQYENHLRDVFGDMLMGDIDSLTVRQWLSAKKAEGLSPWSLRGIKGLLSGIFTAAKEMHMWEGENPCVGIKVKGGNVREKRKLTGQQLAAIIGALADREAFIVQILFGLGLRISECLGLRWGDIENGRLTVQRRWYRGDLAEVTKSDAGRRTLAVGSHLAMEFEKRRRAGRDLVFLDPMTNLPPDDRDLLREEFRPVVKRLGLYYVGFGWHAFRRENVTLRQQVGASPIEAMNAAGHTSLNMTSLYTLADYERQGAHVDAIFAQLIGEGATKQ